MGSPVLHAGAGVLCPHGGQASISASGARVTVGGQAVALQPDPTTVAGCAFTVGTKPQPCVTVRWTSAATRVRVGGQPVLLASSSSLCEAPPPQGPATVTFSQVRVTAV